MQPSPSPLPQDVVQHVQRNFSGNAESILKPLAALQIADSGLFNDRVIRSIVFCAHHYPGTTIEHWIAQARLDYRDLIVAAEYDRADVQIRDMHRPFPAE